MVAWKNRGRNRGNKYGAKSVILDGHKFHSLGEARRYRELKLLMSAKQISGLELQPRYKLKVGGVLVCTWVADFEYWEGDKMIAEDFKGHQTYASKIKIKLFKALFPLIEVRISK